MKIRDLVVISPLLFSHPAWSDTTISVTSNSDDGSVGTLRYALIQVSTIPGRLKAPFEPVVINVDFSGLSSRTITLSNALPMQLPFDGMNAQNMTLTVN